MSKRKIVDQITEAQVDEMVKMRKEGWSCVAIGIKMECHHTTIMDHLKKRGAYQASQRQPKLTQTQLPEEWRKRSRVSHKPTYLSELAESNPRFETNIKKEKINLGKSYKEYVKEEQDRRWKATLQNISSNV